MLNANHNMGNYNDMSTDDIGNANDNMGNAQDVVISVAMLVVMAT